MSATFKYAEPRLKMSHSGAAHERPIFAISHGLPQTRSALDNGECHVTAFRPISEAAHSWSYDNDWCRQYVNALGRLCVCGCRRYRQTGVREDWPTCRQQTRSGLNRHSTITTTTTISSRMRAKMKMSWCEVMCYGDVPTGLHEFRTRVRQL